jgi:hypothetical protein
VAAGRRGYGQPKVNGFDENGIVVPEIEREAGDLRIEFNGFLHVGQADPVHFRPLVSIG